MKTSLSKIILTIFVILLSSCIFLSGCSKSKEQKLTFKALLDGFLAKEIAISMWNAEKSKPEIATCTVAEVNSDYIVVKEQGEKEKKIAIPFHNITSLILSESPPIMVLNDQTLMSGFGETIDNVGYVGSRIERLKPKANE